MLLTSLQQVGLYCAQSLSLIRLFLTLWTVAHQAPLYMGFSMYTGVDCHALLQAIFPTQESNSRLLYCQHCRQILYRWATWEAQVGLLPPAKPLAPNSASHISNCFKYSPDKHLFSQLRLCLWTCLVVQWLRICLPIAVDMGSIPGLGRSHVPQGN